MKKKLTIHDVLRAEAKAKKTEDRECREYFAAGQAQAKGFVAELNKIAKRPAKSTTTKDDFDHLDKLFAESMILATKLAENHKAFLAKLMKISDRIDAAKDRLPSVLVPFVQTAPIKPMKSKTTVYAPAPHPIIYSR
jgi:hypothetical protein